MGYSWLIVTIRWIIVAEPSVRYAFWSVAISKRTSNKACAIYQTKFKNLA
jgi:hypothetical protein